VIERVLIDTGPIVALFSRNDAHHRRCSEALTALTPPLFTCWPVVTEAAWLLRKRPEALQKLFASFGGGLFALLAIDASDLPGIAAIMKQYESSGVQFADAALAHLADRENIRTAFTTDRRDFSIIRLKRNRILKLLPEA
jgi:uncharacterized protein